VPFKRRAESRKKRGKLGGKKGDLGEEGEKRVFFTENNYVEC
jgi:hypothetical protein